MGEQMKEKTDWRAGAICAQTDPEAFFPEVGAKAKEAIRICEQVCRVRGACLQDALDHPESDGIRGGFTDRNRRKIRALGMSAAQAIAQQEMIRA